MMKRIHLISGPRNISTALMYAFGNRVDTSIVDEPFYANYLIGHPNVDHPGRADVLDSQFHDFNEVINAVIFKAYTTPYLFIKNMAHHCHKQDWSFMEKLSNVFLVREPKKLIASFAQVIKEPTLLDIGLALEYEIFNFLLSKGIEPIVLDSKEVLENPRYVLSQLCDRLDMPFDETMLKWSAGPRAEDGSWAKYWYHNVHKSTGFTQKKMSNHTFPDQLQPLLKESNYYYNKLKVHSIKAN